jgi:hypothetical protein
MLVHVTDVITPLQAAEQFTLKCIWAATGADVFLKLRLQTLTQPHSISPLSMGAHMRNRLCQR